MKIKTTTPDVIETTRYMMEYSAEPKAIVDGICKTHKITQDFIREFSQYITPEMFMSSYKLTVEMAEANPHLYSDDKFKEVYKVEKIEEDPNNSTPNPAAINTQVRAINQFFNNNTQQSAGGATVMNGSAFMQLGNMMNSLANGDYEITSNDKFSNISLSMLSKFYSDFKDNEEYLLNEEDILNVIRTSTDEEMNNSDVAALLGINRTIDELLLKRIKDDDLRDTLLLTLQIEGNTTTAAAYKYMSNEVKENLIGDDDADIEEFVKAITESKDLGWKIKMIEKAVSGEIKFEITRKVFDNELVAALSQLPEDQVVKMTKLSDKMPNAFSYKTMIWLLENKEFSEEDLIEMKDVFKKAGLYFNLVKLAKQNNYNKLTEDLKK